MLQRIAAASLLMVSVGLMLLGLPRRAIATTLRVATFNAYLNRASAGELVQDLRSPDDPQIRAVAEIIQRTRPDILLLQEFDYDPDGEGIRLLQANYLGVSQNGAEPLVYPYVYVPPTNTGIPSGEDFNRDGVVTTTPGDRAYGGDSFGFGLFPGQYGMVLLSRYPILTEQIRTFQTFRWQDMPGALLPVDPATGESWYSDSALAVFRLSSKNHADIPVAINGTTLHLLASHPTPPVFDGPEDRNGRRNHDELRLWADYLTPQTATYLYDDAGNRGGLSPTAHFVILGDLNADPRDGDAYPGAIAQLLNHPRISPRAVPTSIGALRSGLDDAHVGPAALDTTPTPVGGLRLDYVLPSNTLEVVDSGVFWPSPTDPFAYLVGQGRDVVSSDHRLVWVDLQVPPAPEAPD